MKQSRWWTHAAAVFLMTGSVNAQDPAPRLPWPATATREPFEGDRQAGYLGAVLDLLDREDDARKDDTVRAMFYDTLGTYMAFVGEHERATKAGDDAYGGVGAHPDAPDGDPLAGCAPKPAVRTIVTAARGRRIVMINEEHRSSIQRAFANELLAPLRAQGFTHLALETMSEDAATLAERGHPVLSTGWYTRDPAFGDLVRRALSMGYAVFGYEAPPGTRRPRPEDSSPADAMNRREIDQARNIFDRALDGDPDAKVLVLGGRGHIAESSGAAWTPMGSVLKELSGLDPLTVNLTTMVEHVRPEFEHWAFKAVDEAGWTGDGAVVLVRDGALWSAMPGTFDTHVFHGRTRFEHGRPHWMRMGGLREPAGLGVVEAVAPGLMQAHLAGERDDAVPVDQVVIWPGEPVPALMLRGGSYVIRVIDRDGRARQRFDVRIE